MQGAQTKTDPWQDVPGEMRRLQERLAARGIPLTLSTAGPGDPLPELVVPGDPGVSLSEAVLEEREERFNEL